MNDISFTEALGIVPGITAIIGGGAMRPNTRCWNS